MRKKSTSVRYKMRRRKQAESVTLINVESEQLATPYDKNLLERVRTQWQFGDWQSLATLEREILQHHPERAKLALLAAAGRSQVGQINEARQFIQLACEWGISQRLVCQVLAAGVHNSLGRAAAIAGNLPRALKHFELAISIGTPGGDKLLLTKARFNQQYNDLGLSPKFSEDEGSMRSLKKSEYHEKYMAFKKLAEFNLGEAWAGNTINTVIFRHHGVLTHRGSQFTAFYVDDRTLRIVRRDLASGGIWTFDLDGEYNLADAHNSISLGVDRACHLHICYDQHATQLRYRRSIRPNDISEWSDELKMTGSNEETVTYPTFVQPRGDFPLTLLYRDGVHDKGTARIKTYDENAGEWTDHASPVLSGSESRPWTSNAYWNHPAVGTDGSLHLSFVWRTQYSRDDDKVNNINIGYACSFDNGESWMTSKGRACRLPITQVNAETIFPVPPGSNLMNQCGMSLDSSNRPHIVFYANDSHGIPQYQYLRYDGMEWHHQIVSRRTQPFDLKGGGTLQVPIGRPEIVLDRYDNVYIITRGDHSGGRLIATKLAAPNYVWNPANEVILWDEDLGFSEPIIDRERWAKDNILSLLLQRCEQPNHDVGILPIYREIRLADFHLAM